MSLSATSTARRGDIGLTFYLLVGLIVFTVLSFFPAVPSSVNGKLKVAGCLVGLAWLAATRWSPDPRLLWREQPLVAGAMVGLVTWALTSALWATDPATALASAGRLAMGAALLVMVFTAARDRSTVLTLTVAFVTGGVLTTAFGAIFKPGPPMPGVVFDPTRLSGGVGEPNELAAMLLPAIALTLFSPFPVVRSRSGRLALAAGMVVLLAGLLLTHSRGGLAAAAVMLGAGLLLGGRLRARIAALCGGVVLVGIGYYAFFASRVSVDRLVSIVHSNSSGRLSDGSGRLSLWKLAAHLIAERPVAGVGAGNYRAAVVEQHLLPDATTEAFPLTVVHNSFLEIQTELGLIGLALFVTLIGGAIAINLRAVRRAAATGDQDIELQARGILVGLIGLLAAHLFLSGEYQVQLWWLLGLALATAHPIRRTREPNAVSGRVV